MRSDPFLIASAQIQGTVANHCQRHDAQPGQEAVDAVLAIVEGQPVGKRQRLLDEATSHFVDAGGWHERALKVLVQAGADVERARQIAAARPQVRGLGGLGEQG